MWWWRSVGLIMWQMKKYYIESGRREISYVTMKRRKANWLGSILHNNCILKPLIKGKVEGRIEVTVRQERRCKQLLSDLKEMRWYWKLKEEALDCTSYREKPNKMQQCFKILLFLISNEAQHVLGDTPPIIRSLKLHKQPLVLHMWKVVGRAVVGCCQVAYADNVQQLHVRQPSTYAKPDAACAVLGSWWWAVCHPKHVELHINME